MSTRKNTALQETDREQLPGGLGNNNLFDQRPTQGDVHGCLLRGKSLISSGCLTSPWFVFRVEPGSICAPGEKKRPAKVLGNRLLVIAS